MKVPEKIVDYVSELAECYAMRLTFDLCSFAQHARRSTVAAGLLQFMPASYMPDSLVLTPACAAVVCFFSLFICHSAGGVAEDVKLCARNSESATELLEAFAIEKQQGPHFAAQYYARVCCGCSSVPRMCSRASASSREEEDMQSVKGAAGSSLCVQHVGDDGLRVMCRQERSKQLENSANVFGRRQSMMS